MLSKLTFKKSKQTEKLKVITFFSVAHFGLLLPKTRLILAPVWPFLKNFWFRFRLLKDNSMMMINSTDFASNLQKNRKMWTISYLLRSHCLGLDLNGLLTRRNFWSIPAMLENYSIPKWKEFFKSREPILRKSYLSTFIHINKHMDGARHILDKVSKWHFFSTSIKGIWPKNFLIFMHG